MKSLTGNRLLATGRNVVAAVLMATASISAAWAQGRNCIDLTTAAETEQEYVSPQGQKATRLAPATRVVPGNEVIWTITARNVCDKPADNVVIANPVPEHMTYVANSAMGVGTSISYSLDGKDFKPATTLTVRDAGATRAARPDEYRHVRWTYTAPFAPGATAFVRFRASVK